MPCPELYLIATGNLSYVITVIKRAPGVFSTTTGMYMLIGQLKISYLFAFFKKATSNWNTKITSPSISPDLVDSYLWNHSVESHDSMFM